MCNFQRKLETSRRYMNEQQLGREFEKFIKNFLKKNEVSFDYERKVNPKPPILPEPNRQEMSSNIRLRKKYYQPDFILNDYLWIECTTRIKNAPKKELLYAHQCNQLLILFLYPESNILQPYFVNTKYVWIDDFISEYGPISNYEEDLKSMRTGSK